MEKFSQTYSNNMQINIKPSVEMSKIESIYQKAESGY